MRGSYKGIEQCSAKGCSALSKSAMVKGNFRNRIANTIMEKHGVPILRVWELTVWTSEFCPTCH